MTSQVDVEFDLIVSLIIRCKEGGVQIINLILDCIFMGETNTDVIKAIKENAREVLEYILQEIDSLIRARTHQNNNPIYLLESFKKEVGDIHKILLSTEKLKSQTAARILIFIGRENPALLVESACYLVKTAKSDEHLALLIRILNSELIDKTEKPYAEKGGHFTVVLEQLLSQYLQVFSSVDDSISDDSEKFQMWNNLLLLLKWENSNKVRICRSEVVLRAIRNNIDNLALLFNSRKLDTATLHILAEILDLIKEPSPSENQLCTLPVQAALNFTNATVNYFFICCREEDTMKKLRGIVRVCEILKRLCMQSKIAKNLALRELLERSIFKSDSIIFGARNRCIQSDYKEKMLLEQNKKITKILPLTKHSSKLNGGIVGFGKRKSDCLNLLPEETVKRNTEQLIKVIKACCTSSNVENQNDYTLDSVSAVSLLLVQLVSPDVMYNGLPWPEEEFSKVTIERDLFIHHLFNDTPLLWHLLSLVAIYRPALCYCSVLIRALMSTLIHQWSSMGDQNKSVNSEGYKQLMDTTTHVIDVMALGQLLPPPLSGIRDVLPYLKHYEIVPILRDCIWCYIRDHVPSPALFACDSTGLHWRDPTLSRSPDIYTNTLRIIMQKNIKSLGHLYSQMFINVPSVD